MSKFPEPFDPEKRVSHPLPAVETENKPFHPNKKLLERLIAVRGGASVEHADARLFVGPKFRLLATPEEQDTLPRLAEEARLATLDDGEPLPFGQGHGPDDWGGEDFPEIKKEEGSSS